MISDVMIPFIQGRILVEVKLGTGPCFLHALPHYICSDDSTSTNL
jgi:hypothetical protein